MLPDVYTIEQQLIDQLECGIEQGRAEAEKELEQERVKAVKELEQERQKFIEDKKEIARKLLSKGMSIEEITDISGLPESDIKMLK